MMNKTILKTKIYDDFSCVADKCPYTCCRDWSNISVDEETIKNYKKDKYIKDGMDFANKKLKMTNNKCHFLDENGLCNLVLKYDDSILSNSCKLFPRNIISEAGIEERGLLNACPEVISLLHKCGAPLSFELNSLDFPEEYYNDKTMVIKNTLIDILQKTKEKEWESIIGKYQSKDYISLISEQLRTIESDSDTVI